MKVPVLSIVDETLSRLNSNKVTEVGLLATSSTIRKRLYEEVLTSNGIKVKSPVEEDQNQMGEIINHLVHSRQDGEDREKLLKITKGLLDQGPKTILLACTDLQLITPHIQNSEIIDTMEILVQATVREILK